MLSSLYSFNFKPNKHDMTCAVIENQQNFLLDFNQLTYKAYSNSLNQKPVCNFDCF